MFEKDKTYTEHIVNTLKYYLIIISILIFSFIIFFIIYYSIFHKKYNYLTKKNTNVYISMEVLYDKLNGYNQNWYILYKNKSVSCDENSCDFLSSKKFYLGFKKDDIYLVSEKYFSSDTNLICINGISCKIEIKNDNIYILGKYEDVNNLNKENSITVEEE